MSKQLPPGSLIPFGGADCYYKTAQDIEDAIADGTIPRVSYEDTAAVPKEKAISDHAFWEAWKQAEIDTYGTPESRMRNFNSGATRDTDTDKIDPEAYFSPQVLRAYCEYMKVHQVQSDGQVRAGDNWQKGIPRDAYMKSLWRHFLDLWTMHRNEDALDASKEEMLCAMLFNVMGYLHEVVEGRHAQ
jgi:hypothetical protein